VSKGLGQRNGGAILARLKRYGLAGEYIFETLLLNFSGQNKLGVSPDVTGWRRAPVQQAEKESPG
jgi:hypothetical protein